MMENPSCQTAAFKLTEARWSRMYSVGDTGVFTAMWAYELVLGLLRYTHNFSEVVFSLKSKHLGTVFHYVSIVFSIGHEM